MNKKEIPWVCTDQDEDQYGRQLSENIFEFKDKKTEPTGIYLAEYTIKDIEDIINAYGYTLFNSVAGLENIVILYGARAQWIIAECLFEMREF